MQRTIFFQMTRGYLDLDFFLNEKYLYMHDIYNVVGLDFELEFVSCVSFKWKKNKKNFLLF